MNVRCEMLAMAVLTGLSGCIAYPKKVEVYDAECRITSHHLTLDYEYLWGHCPAGSEEACLAIIVSTAAASTVVSGSIVIAGNTIYWLSRQDRCDPSKGELAGTAS